MHTYSRTVEVSGSGKSYLLATLPVPPDGVLNRLIVKQTVGGLNGFSFDTLNHQDAGDPTLPYDFELYRIQEQQSVAMFESTSQQYDLKLGYNNAEGLIENCRVRAIYLLIPPCGAGPVAFEISYTIYHAVEPA